MRVQAPWWMVPVLAMLACGGSTLDVGSTGASTSGSTGATSGNAGSGSNEDLSALVGTWSGYVENFEFPSGSDVVVLAFSKQPDGAIAGSVTYGQGSAPPPPTGPDEAYPPSVFADAAVPYFPSLWEGFPYRMLDLQFDGTRLQFHTSVFDLWTAWCALQTPTGDGWPMGQYGCLSLYDTASSAGDGTVTFVDPVTGQTETVPYIRGLLCRPPLNGNGVPNVSAYCGCTATACAMNLAQGDQMSFDMQVSGTKIDGSAVGVSNTTSNVHFTRSP